MRRPLSAGPWMYLGCLCLLSACGAPLPKLPATVPFSGKVTLDDAPLSGVSVMFTSEGTDKSIVQTSAVTDGSGKYDLSIAIGQTKKRGAVPGQYKVTVNQFPKPVELGKPTPPPAGPLPQQYSMLAMTVLKATIPKEGGTQDFELKSR